MANETIMYMSVLLIGMVTFGFFSSTFTTLTDDAKDMTLESNLDDILESVGSKTLDLIATGEETKGQQSGAASFQLVMNLDLPTSFSTERYVIAVAVDSNNQVLLTARKVGDSTIISTFAFSISNNTIAFTGFILSGVPGTPYLQYSWDAASNSERIFLSNN